MNTYFKLNPAFDDLVPSSTLYINETVNKLWAQGKQVFHMGFGESRFDVHPRLQESLARHANKKSYLPARGLPELIDAVAGYYSQKLSINFDSSQVLIGPGSKALIYGLQMVLDADVFLPGPSWVSYGPQAQLLNKRYHYIPSKVDDNYRLSLEELDALVQASDNPCKLLIINSPNNPTGEVMAPDFLEELAQYCRQNNIWVLSDEIYFQVCHGDTDHVSIAQYYPEGTFVLGGLSKHLSIGGWRVGVALFPDTNTGKELLNKMVVFASETWSGVSAPIQYAAIDAYSLLPDIEQYIADCTAIHGIRTRFIHSSLENLGIRCTDAQGAFYIAANFDQYRDALAQLGIDSAAQLATHLLNEYRIAALPGSDFGLHSNMLTLRLSTSYLDMESNTDPKRLYEVYDGGKGSGVLMSVENHPNTQAAIEAFARFVATIQ